VLELSSGALCRNCYFQSKIDLRRHSIYVRMHDAILTLVGRLCSN